MELVELEVLLLLLAGLGVEWFLALFLQFCLRTDGFGGGGVVGGGG